MQKLKGGSSVDTCSPVCNWISVCMMLIIGLMFSLKTKQIDFSNAFAQCDLEEPVCLEMPKGFESADNQDMMLELHKSLHGQTESPKIWFQKLKEGLEDCGFCPYEHLDPCLFVSDNVFAVCYVDDVLFWCCDAKHFDVFIQSFKDDGDECSWEMTVKEDVLAFLGVHITEQNGGCKFTQEGSIDKILKAAGMEDCNGKDTPCSGNGKPLGSDPEGAPTASFCLSGNARADICFAVCQVARFSHNPKASHEAATMRICRHLKKTKSEGLIHTPSKKISVDCCVDADFCGLFSVENPNDPMSVKSRTGHTVLIAGCPVVWVSKSQSRHSLSTQESKCIALSTSMRDLLPIQELIKLVLEPLDHDAYDFQFVTISRAFEDNAACLSLATAKKITPRNRHVGAECHWFRSYVVPDEPISIEKVGTDNQVADILTKNLQTDKNKSFGS